MASLAGIVAARGFPRNWTRSRSAWRSRLAAGIAGGLINGALVSYVGILPFVATLGTLTVFSGFAFVASGGKTIFGGDIPAGFSNFAQGRPAALGLGRSSHRELPNLVIAAAVVFVLVWFVLERLAFGRHLYAMGGGGEAARLAGINVRRVRTRGLRLSRAPAPRSRACMYASRVASANPTQGSRPHARWHRRRLPRHDHERERRAADRLHARRRARSRRPRQRPHAIERR